MGALKGIIKFLALLAIGSAVVGAVFLVRRPRDTAEISFDSWPEVSQNPSA